MLAEEVRCQIDCREGRADAGARRLDNGPSPFEEADVTREGEVLEVVGIAVVGLEERRGGEDLAGWSQDSVHLGYSDVGLLKVLKNCLAVNSVDRAAAKWKVVCVANDMHIRERKDVEVEDARVDEG